MTPLKVSLPWPPKGLNPNARLHHMALAKAKKAFRQLCWALAINAGLKGALAGAQQATVTITFRPPDRRGRDMDNMLASMKAGLDGLADAMGCNDRTWRLVLVPADPVKFGMVDVEVSL
jgi:crossover junction endodeoxyribonuclease RusA